MHESVRCPNCGAELNSPNSTDGLEVQCPRCQYVFETARRSSPAITATPGPRVVTAPEPDEHELFESLPRVVRLNPPVGGWLAVLLMLLIGANALVFLLMAIVWLIETLAGRRADDLRLHFAVEQTALLVPAPCLVAFILWSLVANRNARYLNAAGLIPPDSLILTMSCCIFGGVVAYFHLQQLWRASDPHEIHEPESWRKAPASWLIRAMGALMLAVPIFVFISLRLNATGFREASAWMALLACFSIIFVYVLLIVIVHQIGHRQFQRYIRLYENPP